MRPLEIVTWIAAVGAVVAWMIALVNGLGALRETRKVPGGDAIVRKAAYAWLFAIKKMPPQAQPYVRRLWRALAVFFVCILVGLIAGFMRTGLI